MQEHLRQNYICRCLLHCSYCRFFWVILRTFSWYPKTTSSNSKYRQIVFSSTPPPLIFAYCKLPPSSDPEQVSTSSTCNNGLLSNVFCHISRTETAVNLEMVKHSKHRPHSRSFFKIVHMQVLKITTYTYCDFYKFQFNRNLFYWLLFVVPVIVDRN